MSEKILVIDDQPEILEIIEMIVSNYFSCEIILAENGQAALEKCNSEKFNMICTDYIMPNMNGDELVNLIRSGDSCNKDTDILVVTGNEDLVDKSLREMPGVKVVNKVAEVQALIELFSNYITPNLDE